MLPLSKHSTLQVSRGYVLVRVHRISIGLLEFIRHLSIAASVRVDKIVTLLQNEKIQDGAIHKRISLLFPVVQSLRKRAVSDLPFVHTVDDLRIIRVQHLRNLPQRVRRVGRHKHINSIPVPVLHPYVVLHSLGKSTHTIWTQKHPLVVICFCSAETHLHSDNLPLPQDLQVFVHHFAQIGLRIHEQRKNRCSEVDSQLRILVQLAVSRNDSQLCKSLLVKLGRQVTRCHVGICRQHQHGLFPHV